MKQYFKTKILLVLSVLGVIGVVSGILVEYENNIKISQAGAGHNVLGFAWSENIGWISFNSSNCDTDNNGFIDTDAITQGCGGDNLTDIVFDYGVNVDLTTGNFSGYAWSSNVGWISFQENDAPNYEFNSDCSDASCIGENNCTACYNSTDNNVYGWAKILTSGDDGWLKMNGAWNDGVNISNNSFAGWAWNDDNNNMGIGWVSFNCSNNASCGVSDYKVYLRNNPPVIVNGGSSMAGVCELGASPQAQFIWAYSDLDGNVQGACQIQISEDIAFTLPLKYDSGKVGYSSNSWTVPAGILEYGKEYWYKVKVWDSNDAESNVLSCNFDGLKNISHQYPTVAFSHNPAVNIKQFQEIIFDPVFSQSYGSTSISSFEWDFDYDETNPTEPSLDDSTDPVDPTTTYSYAEEEIYEINLKVTDSDGYSCSDSKTINVGSTNLPDWKEVNP